MLRYFEFIYYLEPEIYLALIIEKTQGMIVVNSGIYLPSLDSLTLSVL